MYQAVPEERDLGLAGKINKKKEFWLKKKRKDFAIFWDFQKGGGVSYYLNNEFWETINSHIISVSTTKQCSQSVTCSTIYSPEEKGI